jgi:hypothetical protein
MALNELYSNASTGGKLCDSMFLPKPGTYTSYYCKVINGVATKITQTSVVSADGTSTNTYTNSSGAAIVVPPNLYIVPCPACLDCTSSNASTTDYTAFLTAIEGETSNINTAVTNIETLIADEPLMYELCDGGTNPPTPFFRKIVAGVITDTTNGVTPYVVTGVATKCACCGSASSTTTENPVTRFQIFPANGQTTYQLPSTPNQDEEMELIVNDATYQFLKDYTLAGDAFIWTSTSFQLSSTDEVFFNYVPI